MPDGSLKTTLSALSVVRSAIGKKVKSIDRGAPTDWLDGKPTYEDRWRATARFGDDVYKAVVGMKKTWQFVATVGWIGVFAAGGGWWWEAQQPEVVPYYIPYDRIGDPGEVFVARATEPPVLMRIAAAARVVKIMFMLSSDGNVNEDNKIERLNILRGRAQEHYESWVRIAGSNGATARIVTIVSSKVRGGDVINVIWDEVDWKDGRVIANRRRNGDFTLKFEAPKKTGDIVVNKTGLFLVDYTDAEEQVR